MKKLAIISAAVCALNFTFDMEAASKKAEIGVTLEIEEDFRLDVMPLSAEIKLKATKDETSGLFSSKGIKFLNSSTGNTDASAGTVITLISNTDLPGAITVFTTDSNPTTGSVFNLRNHGRDGAAEPADEEREGDKEIPFNIRKKSTGSGGMSNRESGTGDTIADGLTVGTKIEYTLVFKNDPIATNLVPGVIYKTKLTFSFTTST